MGASLRVAYQLCNRAGERAKVESQRSEVIPWHISQQIPVVLCSASYRIM